MKDGLQQLQQRDKERDLAEYLNDKLIAAIRAHRIHQGISQRKLSRLSGVTQSIISRMENKLAIPEFETLIKLAKTLDLDVDIVIRPNEDV